MEKDRSSLEVAKQISTRFINICEIYKRWKEEESPSRRIGSASLRKSMEKQDRVFISKVKSDPKMTAVDIRKCGKMHWKAIALPEIFLIVGNYLLVVLVKSLLFQKKIRKLGSLSHDGI